LSLDGNIFPNLIPTETGKRLSGKRCKNEPLLYHLPRGLLLSEEGGQRKKLKKKARSCGFHQGSSRQRGHSNNKIRAGGRRVQLLTAGYQVEGGKPKGQDNFRKKKGGDLADASLFVISWG